MSDIVKAPSLPERMEYAKALATASLLPDAYRGKPGNVLLAVEYGHALGVPPMTAIQGIDVIKGKPTLSADLMAALVRRAGHTLRVQVKEGPVAVATLIRSDDPDFPFVCEWDWARADRITDPKSGEKLTSKPNWQNYPEAMLKARAVSEVVRQGASEVLHGVVYTPEELGAVVDGDGDVVDAELVEDTDLPEDPVTQDQLTAMHAAFGDVGITSRDDGLTYVANVINRQVESTKDLTKAEASDVIDALRADIDAAVAADKAAAELDDSDRDPDGAADHAEAVQQELPPDGR